MLTVRLRDLRQGPVVWDEEVGDPSEVWPDVDLGFVGALRLHGEATPARAGDVHVGGRLEAPVRLSCVRCLAPLDARLDIPLDLWFRRDPTDVEEGGEAVFRLPDAATEVDLTAPLREELLLARPAYPLCRPECGGLCPQCGVRRDEEECDCTFEEADPRWDALRALR